MCGIAGIVTPGSASLVAVRAMTDLMAYRGPDGEAIWRSDDAHCALGHRRLAIIDLSPAAGQPMVDLRRGLSITYNGEIYNYRELRDRLRSLGFDFRTSSDTEVLLAAYARWGERCLDELNGMFAFAIWDGARKTLFCARDRFGEKPFYYARLRDGFAFASEAKALALLHGVSTEIDAGILASYAIDGSTRVDASDRTLLRGVRQLLPAQCMEVRLASGELTVAEPRAWWAIDVRGRQPYGTGDLPSDAARLRDLLHDAVRIRLRSDVPVGSCLSGGLDSSTVVALMRGLDPPGDIRTFTGRFPGDPLDEGPFAHAVIDAFATTAFEVEPTPARFLEDAGRIYRHAEFPIGGLSQFAQWCVFELASRNGVVVLLDGQGSDELLGGYGNAIVRAFLDQLWASDDRAAWLVERRAAARDNPAVFSWPRLAFTSTAARPFRRIARRLAGKHRLVRADLFDADWLEAATAELPQAAPEESCESAGALSRILWTLTFRTMLSSLLRFGDRLGMAHSREVRLPFCDHRIAEFAFSLAPELLVGTGQAKRVLREAARDLVPAAVVARRKQGFLPPQEAWMAGPLAGWARELGCEPGPVGEALDRGVATALATSSPAVRRRESPAVWELANLSAWSRYSLQAMREAGQGKLVII